MKITKVEHWTEHFKLIKPYTIAYETYSDVVNHFVRIETDTGSFGLGTAAPEDYVTGESTVDCKSALDSCLESLLFGQDIRNIEDLVRKSKEAMPKTPAARAAVDMALYDLNAKLMKCGGIFPALQIAEIAHLASIDLMWGCMDERIVSISAALHAALASPATRYVDLDGSLNLARDLVEGGFRLKDGELSITDQPGLGVNLK